MITGIAFLVALQSVVTAPPHSTNMVQRTKLSIGLKLEPGPLKIGAKHRAEILISNLGKETVFLCQGLSSIPNHIGFLKGKAYQGTSRDSGVPTWAGATKAETAKQIFEGTKLSSGEQLSFPIELPCLEISGDIVIFASAMIMVGNSPTGNLASWSKTELATKQRIYVRPNP